MDGRAHAPERRGQSALCKEKDRERNRLREREREQGERARARVLWTAYGALVLLLSSVLGSVAGLCGPALCPGLVLLLSLSWPRP